ncbi:tail fiber assembly protein [Limnobaculum zhutongyuii]|nr:tail fiber assembly protein [Limnobaculum zhutongyuii]
MAMKYYYSPAENLMYSDINQSAYEASKTWPLDLIEISADTFSEYAGTPPSGKKRGSTDGGLPTWIDIPPPTKEELTAAMEMKKNMAVDNANAIINRYNWPSKLTLGRLSDVEKIRFNAWLDYIDAVIAVDASKAPDIKLPIPPELM